MGKLLLLPLLFIFLFSPAYAQIIPDEVEDFTDHVDPAHTDLGIKEFISGIFDDIGNFGQAQTNGSEWFDQQKQDEINKVNEDAIQTGKTSIELWWNFHELIVDSVFAGSPVPFDRGIIVLVSIVVTTIVVLKLGWEFFKKTWKIALALIIFVTIIWIAGIEFIDI